MPRSLHCDVHLTSGGQSLHVREESILLDRKDKAPSFNPIQTAGSALDTSPDFPHLSLLTAPKDDNKALY